MRPALSVLAILLHRLARHEPAATVAGFVSNPMTAVAVPGFGTAITHLREVLGDKTYESLARKGEAMNHRRNRDVRLRPDRPGSDRTDRRLEINDLRGTLYFVSESRDAT